MIGRMRQVRSFVCVTAVLLAASGARAATTSDHPAAIVVYPEVRVDRAADTDTRIQITNTSDELVDLRCFYEYIERECVNGQPGESCQPFLDTCTGTCTEEQRQIPFRLRLTRQQPLAWSAGAGLTDFPLDGDSTGPDGQTNTPSLIPPLGAGPISAVLRCAVVANDTLTPLPDNALVGLATIERRRAQPVAEGDAAQYRAIGIAGFPDASNGDTSLLLGGPEQAEYEACPSTYLLEHFFTGAPLRTGEMTAEVGTDLVLATCGSTQGELSSLVAQFLVHNEFAQRFSTSTSVRGQLVRPLATIASNVPERSIFSVNVSGTLAGRTQIRGIGGGLHAVAFETHRDRATDLVHTAAIEVHSVNEFADGDRLILPRFPCLCDCNRNDDVTIDELITGVGIAIGQTSINLCRRCDRDENGQVGIDELVSSVRSSINGCEPAPLQARAAAPSAIPPPVEPSTTIGPEITFFGLATADDQPLQPDEVDNQGRPVYLRPYGQGFTVIIEARRGSDNRPPASSTYSVSGFAPDLQVLASRALGDGNPTVCELDGVRGGIPAVPDLAFTSELSTIDAMNDLGCRAYNRMPAGAGNACTRSDGTSLFGFVSETSQLQFCIPIARAWALEAGQSTIFAARLRDVSGTFGPVSEMVVRVDPLP